MDRSIAFERAADNHIAAISKCTLDIRVPPNVNGMPSSSLKAVRCNQYLLVESHPSFLGIPARYVQRSSTQSAILDASCNLVLVPVLRIVAVVGSRRRILECRSSQIAFGSVDSRKLELQLTLNS